MKQVFSIDPDPVSFLQVNDISFCVCVGAFLMASESPRWALSETIWQAGGGGGEGGEREEEKAVEGSCSALTIGSAWESILFVYRPFHSPLPVTSLVSVPLIVPDI